MDKKATFKEVFADMKELFADIFKEEISKQKFADYKTEDGSIIRTDTEEIAVGSKLQVITPEGIMDVPADVTEVVIMVNDVPTKLVVENGIVKEMEQVGTTDAPAPVPGEEMANNSGEFDAKFAELVDRIAKLEEALGLAQQSMESANAAAAQANAQVAVQNDLNKKLFALIEKVADSPVVESVKNKEVKENKFNSLDEFRKRAFGA